MNPSLRLTRFALAVGVLGAAAACDRGDRERRAASHTRVADLDPATAEGVRRHGPEGRQLRDVMHDLAERTAYAPTNQVPADPESNKAADPRVFAEVEALAASLADNASRIPAAAEGVNLFSEDRQAFEAEAATLRRQAEDLGAAARSHNVERMQRTFDRINATCIGCHSQFRDFAGQLDFQRASASDPPARVGPDAGALQ